LALYTNPAEFVMQEKDIEWWLGVGQFVFHCGWSEYVVENGAVS
jgi:hypothetical protein